MLCGWLGSPSQGLPGDAACRVPVATRGAIETAVALTAAICARRAAASGANEAAAGTLASGVAIFARRSAVVAAWSSAREAIRLRRVAALTAVAAARGATVAAAG